MTDLDRLVIEQACIRLMTRYCYLVDAYDHAALVQLWAEDGVWVGMKGPMHGHAEMLKYLDAKTVALGRHYISNMIVTVIDADHAEGGAYFNFYTAPGHKGDGPAPAAAPAVSGRYTDRFVRTPAGWRFAHKAIAIEFKVT
jgi:ketosteroid isomerase-like protein